MTDNSMQPPSGGTASPPAAEPRPGSGPGRALVAAIVVLVGSAVAGVVGGVVWAVVAPRVQYQMYSLNPPTAYATNAETSAFIAADAWYCFIALASGALAGLLAYLFAIRRYGALPMTAALIGSVAAAFIAAWVGHLASGGPGFDHLLATSKPGTYLYAPISLGSKGALAFWPLGAAIVAGGIELVSVMRARHHVPAGGVSMPGMDSFSTGSYPVWRPDSGQPGGDQPGSGQPGSGQYGSGHYGLG
jgi:hypothetical protein